MRFTGRLGPSPVGLTELLSRMRQAHPDTRSLPARHASSMSPPCHILDRPRYDAAGRRRVVDDNAVMSAADLIELNRDIQGAPTIRLLATLNLGVYAALMERHLSDGVIGETELVVRLERDLDQLDRPGGEQSGLAMIKSWASQGWLHRVADQRAEVERNLCYLTQDARRALDFLRGMRRQDTIATGGSINGIASRLKQVALRVGNDPERIRAGIAAEIAALHAELDALDGAERHSRPGVDLTDMYDEACA